MHYNSVRDAALYAAVAIFAAVPDKSNSDKMIVGYIAIFLVLLFFLEAARDWTERRRK